MIVLAVTILIGLLTVYCILNSVRSRAYNFPPSPPRLSYNPSIVKYLQDFQQHEIFTQLTDMYGPIVRLKRFNWIFSGRLYLIRFLRQIYIVNDAAAAKKTLTTTDFIRGPSLQEFTKGLTDYALFVLQSGTVWHRHRKLLQPSFGPHHLKSSIKVTWDKCNHMGNQWRSLIESNAGQVCVVDVYKLFQVLTLDIIGEVAFSQDFKGLDAFFTGTEISEGQRHWDRLAEAIQRRFLYLPLMWGFHGLAPSSPGIASLRSSLVRFLQKLIDQKREDLRTKAVKRENKAKDLLDRLLEAEGDDKKTLTDDEIQGEAVGFFLAGHETTSNALTWAIYTLSQHPDIQDKLAKEVRSASTDLSLESVQNLEYLDWVVKEVLRLHPVASAVLRISAKDTTLGGYDVPKDSTVLVAIRTIHHNPKYWPDPLSFQPDRWKQVPQPGTYLPFGDGQHVCIGMKLALLEIKVCLMHILSRFSFSLVPGQDLKAITSITTGLKKGCLVEIRPRN